MTLAQSRLTAQSQISVPAEVRRRLGVGPGSVIDWHVEDDSIVVRRAGATTSLGLHAALFAKPPKRRTLKELKAGIGLEMKRRHARG